MNQRYEENVLLLKNNDETITEIPLSAIELDPNQDRKHFDEEKLKQLSITISKVGLTTPIVVIPLTNGKYRLNQGERRFRACQLAKLDVIPSRLVTQEQAADPEMLSYLMLIENQKILEHKYHQ